MSKERSSSQRADDIVIRDYRLDRDFDAVAELLHSEGMFNQERDRYEQLEKLGDNVHMKVAVAMGERIVGSLYINGGIGVVEGVVVHPDFRRRGVGRRLVKEAMRQLSTEGHRYIELQVDDDRDDLKAWYESLGFERNYHVVGMMQELEPAKRAVRASDIEVDVLDHETVHRAFNDIYFRYRSHSGYFEPISLQVKPEELTWEQIFEIQDRYPGISSTRLFETLSRGGYDQPPILGDRVYWLDWRFLDNVIRQGSIPALRNACFYGRAHEGATATPWVIFSPEDDSSQSEEIQCWLGRVTEAPMTLVRRKEVVGEPRTLEDVFELIPNNTFLFLRQIKSIQRFGRSPKLSNLSPDGDFLCLDQGNNTIFAFRIISERVELINMEGTAILLEDMVRYAKCYEIMAKDRRPA